MGARSSKRAKPVTPKAGFTSSKRRYENGGKIKSTKKKS